MSTELAPPETERSAEPVLHRRRGPRPGGLLALWRELGPGVWTSLIGIVLAVAAVLAIVQTVTESSSEDLLMARTEVLEGVVGELAADGLPLDPRDRAAFSRFDRLVRLRLLGGDTIRVKLWRPDGSVAYSDVEDLVGRRFPMDPSLEAALRGVVHVEIHTPEDLENEFEQSLGDLIEFYLPIEGADGEVDAVFEAYQLPDSMVAHVEDMRRNTWLSVGIGVTLLVAALAILMLATARALDRRRRQAESLVDALLTAQEDERRRIAASLHDDIGQTMYRIHYGIEGARVRLEQAVPISDELAHLSELVDEVDGRLRSELKSLHEGVVAAGGLEPAVAELCRTVEAESDLSVTFDVDEIGPLGAAAELTLYRTASEALLNARKHSGASSVAVRFRRRRGGVQLVVSDDGRGYRGERGLGLTAMQERIDVLGGTLKVSGHRTGTTVKVWVPEGVIS